MSTLLELARASGKAEHVRDYTYEDLEAAAALIKGEISAAQYNDALHQLGYNGKKGNSEMYKRAFMTIRQFVLRERANLIILPRQ